MSTRISPTAHYTGFVWSKNGLSFPGFETATGRTLYAALAPMNALYRALGKPSLEDMLLARHRLIDAVLIDAIEAGEVVQVLEIAAGYSPRGVRLMRRFGGREGFRYIEADLAPMAAQKRSMLAATGHGRDSRHRVVAVDALATSGGETIAEVAARELDPSRGVAVITEGLLNYFPRETANGIWGRIADALAGFPSGLYVSELHLLTEVNAVRGSAWFQSLLGLFARGRVHIHYDTTAEVHAALEAAGFAVAALHRPIDFAERLGLRAGAGSGLVRVIAARTAMAPQTERA